MISIGVALLFLFLLGLPWALITTRSWMFAVALSPLLAGLACSLAAVASLASRTALAPWLLTIGLGGWVLLFLLARKQKWTFDRLFHPKILVPALSIGAIPLAGLRVAPVAWDARSCWWFHAAWFVQGGGPAKAAFANPAFDFAHKDYPPFSSAAVAGSWLVSGAIDYKTAQVVGAVITYSAVLSLVLILSRLMPLRNLVGAGVLIAAMLGVQGVAGEGATNGYNDLLWSAALTGSALALFLSRERVLTRMGPVLLAVAALSKNEGLVVAVVLVAILAIKRARAPRSLLYAIVALSAGLVWQLMAWVHGARSDLFKYSFARSLSASRIIERGELVLEFIWQNGGWIIAAGLLLLLISSPALTRELGRNLSWLWALAAAYLLFLGVTYTLFSVGLEHHLNTSIRRTIVFPKVVSLTTTALLLLHAVASLRSRALEDSRSDFVA